MLFTFRKRDSLLSYLTGGPLSSTFWSLRWRCSSIEQALAPWTFKLREDRTEKARSSLNHAANFMSTHEFGYTWPTRSSRT
jgi:hypothetical protein